MTKLIITKSRLGNENMLCVIAFELRRVIHGDKRIKIIVYGLRYLLICSCILAMLKNKSRYFFIQFFQNLLRTFYLYI